MDKEKNLNEIMDREKSSLVDGKVIDHRIVIKNSHKEATEKSVITSLKEFVKKNEKLYYFIIKILSPICPNEGYLKRFIGNHKEGVVLNLGSGNKRIGEHIINVDLFNYKNVDIVTDLKSMSVKSASADAALSVAVLEHVDNPEVAIAETARVLKKGGECFFTTPFVFGFHASPYDFTRWTHEGLRKMFERHGLEVIEVGIQSGPTSAFLCITIDFLSILLSFGMKQLYEIWTIIFMLILWPFKFMDLILIKIPFSKVIAANFYIIARKK